MPISGENVRPVVTGHIKIVRENKLTGEKTTVFDKPNLVLYMGMDILAKLVTGNPEYKIWGMYVGFTNDSVPTAEVEPDNTPAFADYGANEGVLKVPLLLTPSVSSTYEGYTGNKASFVATVTGTGTEIGGYGEAPFENGSQIFEVCLVACPVADSTGTDLVFSRKRFNPGIAYDSAYSLTIIWSLTFTLAV